MGRRERAGARSRWVGLTFYRLRSTIFIYPVGPKFNTGDSYSGIICFIIIFIINQCKGYLVGSGITTAVGNTASIKDTKTLAQH